MPRKLQHPGSTSVSQSAANKAVKRADTKPEIFIRAILHQQGYRFRKDLFLRLDDGGRGVRPDIVFVKKKLAVFIDGCFWHSCPLHGRIPTTNIGYWVPKLRGNAERDKITNDRLRKAGWKVIRFWEHTQPERVAASIIKQFHKIL
jgi:DNA mismatch endonuclease (patch repair protein)